MIGFYDYTILLTFLGLASSVFGMTRAMDGNFRLAIACLAFSGLCDTFDGRIARSKKTRSQDEKLYGIQLDSLCDVVCFGIFPAMICYMLGLSSPIGLAAIAYYCICSVIRLAFFNVLETNKLILQDNGEKVYHGLPITSIAVILPLTFLLEFFMKERTFCFVLLGMLLCVATCFILDFKIKKPKLRTIGILIAIVAVAVTVILLFSRFHIIQKPINETPLIDQIGDDAAG